MSKKSIENTGIEIFRDLKQASGKLESFQRAFLSENTRQVRIHISAMNRISQSISELSERIEKEQKK